MIKHSTKKNILKGHNAIYLKKRKQKTQFQDIIGKCICLEAE